MNRTYKLNESYRGRFLKIPKELFEQEKYISLSPESKLLYALLLERTGLSQKNGMANENGEIYVIMPRREVMNIFGVTENTARGLFSSLENASLILDERKGKGFANRIYVLKPEKSTSKFEVQDPQKEYGQDPQKEYGLDPQKEYGLDPQKLMPINININNTDKSNTEIKNIGHATSHQAREQTDIEEIKKILRPCDFTKVLFYVGQDIKDTVVYAYKSETVKIKDMTLDRDTVRTILRHIDTDCVLRIAEAFRGNAGYDRMSREKMCEIVLSTIVDAVSGKKN